MLRQVSTIFFKSGKSEDLSVVKIDPFAKHAFVLLCQTKKKHRTLKDLWLLASWMTGADLLVIEKMLGKLPNIVTAHVSVSLSSFCRLAFISFPRFFSINGTNIWISKYQIHSILFYGMNLAHRRKYFLMTYLWPR